MHKEDIVRISKLLDKGIKQKRKPEDIKATFIAAGIINKNGNLKSPYKNIYLPTK